MPVKAGRAGAFEKGHSLWNGAGAPSDDAAGAGAAGGEGGVDPSGGGVSEEPLVSSPGFAAAMGRTNGAVEGQAAALLKSAKKTFGKRRDAVGTSGKSVDTSFNNSGGAA